LLHPKHVREVAEAIGWVANSTAEQITVTRQVSVSEDIEVKATSLGIQISGSKIESASGYINHYALSCQNEIMAEGDATTLAELILQLKHPVSSSEMMKGNQGVYHLLVQS
jgi:hypothetical protein